MYGHPLAGFTTRAAIRARLIAGAVGVMLGLASAVLFFQLGAAA